MSGFRALGEPRGSDISETSDDHVVVSTTRLTPPPRSPWLLKRTALDLRLDESLNARLTTVVAGAGFGKTTALSSWASSRPCSWYILGTEDREVGILANGLVEAVRVRVPNLPPDTAAAAGSGRGPKIESSDRMRGRSWGALLSGALQEHLRSDLVLVVDDLHELQGAEAALGLLGELCREAPARLHLILASRRELPFGIERMRGRGQVLELNVSDLAFSVEEVEDLLKLSLGLSDKDLAESLHGLTGGWPGAVRLALEFLRGTDEGGRGGGSKPFAEARNLCWHFSPRKYWMASHPRSGPSLERWHASSASLPSSANGSVPPVPPTSWNRSRGEVYSSSLWPANGVGTES